MRTWFLIALLPLTAGADDLFRGRILDDVKCAADSSQSYALYLPSNYSPDRDWSLILGFDPRARGRTAVERYQVAAETYGYIVAGSNNSSNGSWEKSMLAVQAMAADVTARFRIDEKRVYTAGLSGGARVALGVALGTDRIAGVIASSAGYPDSKPRKSVPFAVFGTAGTEDFNYLELHQLDRALMTPHHLAIFEGGHTWLSSELAVEAIEWMEIQAMKSGRRIRDQAFIEKNFAARLARAEALTNEKDAYLALAAIALDFAGLRDVSTLAARETELRQRKTVKAGIKKDLTDEQREERLMHELGAAESGLADADNRVQSLAELRNLFADLSKKANAANDSGERRLARRVLRGAVVSSAEVSKDPEYRKLIEKYRLPGRGF